MLFEKNTLIHTSYFEYKKDIMVNLKQTKNITKFVLITHYYNNKYENRFIHTS